MIPKVIHLCWFSDDPFPVEIKLCLETWKRLLPDFRVRRWTYQDAKAIGCRFIDEALEAKKWAFAADAVRFYAVYSEGGIYMDSDIFIKKRFDHLIPERGFVTTFENENTQLQAAFFMGEKGNLFCKEMFEHYQATPFLNADGSYNTIISPVVMFNIASRKGCLPEDREQHPTDDITIYPSHYVIPRHKYPSTPDTFAEHRIYGSWRKRKFGRKLELFVKHVWLTVRFSLLKR